jgi:hypothetical protein
MIQDHEFAESQAAQPAVEPSDDHGLCFGEIHEEEDLCIGGSHNNGDNYLISQGYSKHQDLSSSPPPLGLEKKKGVAYTIHTTN